MQGLGVFACRKDTWPGLNPRLRGFGGEEGCLHEKFRQRDATTLCLPFLRWLHRFERPIGPSYQTTWEDRIRNYLILFDELGMDATPVVQHFEELLGTESAHSIAEAVTKEIANPFSFFDAIYCVNLDRDTARWEQVRERFQELGISGRVRRFPAIETPHSHHIGCALSHRAIIAEARRLALGNVLVFEDDVIFAADTLAVLEGAIQELRQQTWWMLFLGGHTWGESYPKANACEFLEVPGGMTCSHAVAYNHTIYDRILADIPESPSEVALWLRVHYGIDQYFKNALGEFRLVTRPVIATQPTILSEEKRPFSETYLARHADWSEYYELAEADVFSQWRLIQAFIGEEPRLDLTAVLDFACGRGRIAERFAAIAGSLICSDINAEALACCRQRFANSPNVTCVINDGLSIPLPDESLTFVYSWDSMVNFNAAELRTYLREFKRILRPGGMALVHHSNYAALGSPARVWNENPACRAYVSASDVGMICDQYALPIVRQQVIDWTEPSLDCLTMFRKPGAPARDRLDRTVPKLPGSVSKGANRHGMRFGFIDPYITYGPRDVHESALGGTETSFVLLAEALQALGHEAIVYLKDPGCSEFNGVHYRGLSDARSISHDAVLARWPELFDDLDAKAGRRIWWCHKAVDPESTQMARTVNAFPVVTSQYQARQLADLGWCDRFAVIPLGCRIRHSPRHRRKPFTAVWISAFDHGLDTLIDIWRSIRRQLPRGSELIIAGGPTVYREYGGYLVEWEQRLRYETRDEPDILWRGPVAPGELSKLLSIAGILPYASNIAETFCLSVLEAQAAGCLPIVTPYGALTERIVHGETGWIESEDRLGERILDYSRRAGSPDVARMRRAAKRSAEGFTWATVARQIEDEMLS
jgi:glycosyltransferase involved in cell wall biosynthesis/GR25 family glycosyltransferase involved in LPS biosynthesis